MKIEQKIIDDVRGIVQITTADERWYLLDGSYLPSVTFITNSYPKGIAYMQWLAKHGWDDAEAIKVEAGDRGTIVHHAVEKLMLEGKLKMDEPIKDREGVERQMTPDEYYYVMTFAQWYESVGKPKALQIERTVVSKEHGYAGTLDYIFETPEGNLLLDLKTSKYIWPSHRLQVSALKQACTEEGMKVDKIAILQVGYTLNKTTHYKLTEVDDQFPLFLATKQVWANEHGDEKPKQRDFPLEIVLTDKENTDGQN